MTEEYTSPREKGVCADCGKEKWLYEDKYQCIDCLIRANQDAVSDEPLREVPEWVRCSHCNQPTGITDDDGKCPTCIAKTSNFGKDDISVTASAPGEATVHCLLVDCSHDESVMCRNCHPEAFDNNIEAPTRPGDLNCDVCHGALPAVHRMLSVCEKCEGSNFHETIKAREREASDLRYRVREKDRAYTTLYNRYLDMLRQRDQWKYKAEQAEMEYQNALQDGSACPDPDLHKGDTLDGWAAEEIGRLREEKEDLRNLFQEQGRYVTNLKRENNALHDAVEHLREQVPDTRWCCYHNRQENHAGEAQE